MKPIRLCRGDVAVACAVLAAALAVALFLWFGQPSATQVTIQYPDGKSAVYSLMRDRVLEVDGNNEIRLIVEIQNGKARVRESTCPDQVCVHGGWLSRSGQIAACVPAGLCVQILGGDAVIDGVTA